MTRHWTRMLKKGGRRLGGIALALVVALANGSLSAASVDPTGFHVLIPKQQWYFSSPGAVAVDNNGYIYVLDIGDNSVQKFDDSGNLLLKWGRMGSGDGQFVWLTGIAGIAADAGGNVYVADSGNHRIQKFDGSGNLIAKWGGSGAGNGQFNNPGGIAVDADGNVYVADTYNHRVQKFDSSGNWMLTWGSYDQAGVRFNFPGGIAVDGSGSVYVADTNGNRIQKFDGSGNLILKWGSKGSENGKFNNPRGIATDSDGNVYVADSDNSRIQKFDGTGIWVASWGDQGGGEGQLDDPRGMATDADGHVYVADWGNHRIQIFDGDGSWKSKWAGQGSGNGELKRPDRVAFDAAGRMYVSDSGNHRIQLFDAAGQWIAAWGGPGSGQGEFSNPTGIAIDGDGYVYVADRGNQRVQKFGGDGQWVAEWGSSGSGDGEFTNPNDIAVDSSGDVYVVDTGNSRVQKFDRDGIYIGQWGQQGSGDGQFNYPSGITVDDSGHVYVADTSNRRIQVFGTDGGFKQKWTLSGYPGDAVVDRLGFVYVTDTMNSRVEKRGNDGMLLQRWGKYGTGDGQFSYPVGIAQDGDGSVFVADTYNHRIQKLAALADSVISPTVGSFDKRSDAQSDVTTTLTLNGNALSGIYNGGTALVEGADYTVIGDTVAVKREYLSGLPTGSATLTFHFSAGAERTLTIEVYESTVLPPEAPQLESASPGNGQVNLIWRPANDATSYKIYARTLSNAYGTEAATVSGTVYSHAVTGLDNGTTYYFVVRAVNDGGEGAVSNEISAVPGTVPDAPTEVAAVAGDGRATVSFTPPNDDGGRPIAGYKAISSPDGVTATGMTSPILVPGLKNGKVYTFTVKAFNVIGESPSSAVSNTVTPSSSINRPSDPSGPSPNAAEPEPDDDRVSVLINGQPYSSVQVGIARERERIVTVVSFPGIRLEDKIADQPPHAVITLWTRAESDAVRGEWSVRTFGVMREKDTVVEIRTANAIYTVPVQAIDPKGLLAAWAESADEADKAKVQVEVSAPDAHAVEEAKAAAAAQGAELVIPPLTFAVRAFYGGKTIELSDFGAYAQRLIAISDGIDPVQITTAVVVEPDGTLRHAPTKIVEIDGKIYAKANSLTNGLYALVRHPLTFADMEGHWAQREVDDAGSRMIAGGTGGGLFVPDRAVTRAEFAAILVRGLGLKPENGASPFSDAASADEHSGAIAAAKAYGLVNGYEDGTFRPQEKVTREQAMAMIARAAQLTGLRPKRAPASAVELLSRFSDAADLSAWAKPYAADSLSSGLITGRANGRLEPQADITRAELTVIVERILRKSGFIE